MSTSPLSPTALRGAEVLVTGATGFLGSHLAEALIARGAQVRALVRASSPVAHLAELGATLVRGDFADPASLEAAVAGATHVVHCAGGGKVKRRDDFAAANTETTRALLAATLGRAPEVQRFVLVSSAAASGPSDDGAPRGEDAPPAPRSLYGESKLAAEALVLEVAARLPVTIVRPPALYGPRDTRMLPLFRGAARGWVPRLGGGGRTSIVYGPDCAEALVATLLAPHPSGRVYFVEDGAPLDQGQLAAAIAEAVGARPRTVPVPAAVLGPAAWVAELLGRLKDEAVVLTRDKVRDLTAGDWVVDGRRIRAELGWAPRVTFEDGARRTAAWYREAGWL